MRSHPTGATAGLGLAALLFSACADEPQTPLAPDHALHFAAAAHLSAWSPATALAELNTPWTDGCPFLTKRGDALYFGSSRPGGYGDLDLYVAYWDDDAQRWGTPTNLGPEINTPFNESCAVLLNSEKEMIFYSNRPGGVGGFDLWSATRHDHGDALAWEAPENLSALNSGAAEFGHGAYEEEDGSTVVYFNSNRPGSPGLQDLYTSTRPEGGAFSAPVLVPELNSPALDQFARISKDGREIIFASDRPGTLGGLDLWSATREHTSEPWGTPANLGTINSTVHDAAPALSWDGTTLVFLSTRSGGLDLYQSSRTRIEGRGR